jgi:hypothetical protein
MHPEPLRDRLRAAIPAAMKSRDRVTTATLRAALAAIDNAEAVEASAAAAGAGAIEASPVGLGVADVARRELTEEDVAAIVRAEIEERVRAAQVYEQSGHTDKAVELRGGADALAVFLE